MMIDIQPFDLKNASTEEYRLLNDFENIIRKERMPEDPPIPLEENINHWQNIPNFLEIVSWAAWNDDKSTIVGAGEADILRNTQNEHIVQFDIRLLPEYRRQGWGCQFFSRILEVTAREGKRLLIANTNSRMPSGEAFMNRLGATKGMETHTNQLAIAKLDRSLLSKWQDQAHEKASGFELGLWVGPYPEDKLQQIAHLVEVMNSAPLDNLDVEDFHFTPEQLQEMEKEMVANGTERWTIYAQDKVTKKFVGYTEIIWNPNRPKLAFQGATGVFPEYRGHGIGRWLKAAMLEKLLAERPQVEFIRTGNANSNARMLKINHELGFKPFIANCIWQIELEKAKAYLADK